LNGDERELIMSNLFFDDEIVDIQFDFGIYMEIKEVKFF